MAPTARCLHGVVAEAQAKRLPQWQHPCGHLIHSRFLAVLGGLCCPHGAARDADLGALPSSRDYHTAQGREREQTTFCGCNLGLGCQGSGSVEWLCWVQGPGLPTASLFLSLRPPPPHCYGCEMLKRKKEGDAGGGERVPSRPARPGWLRGRVGAGR